MSYDEWDAMEDAGYEEMVESFYETHGPEIAEEAVADFQNLRLQSYFRDNPQLIEGAARQLDQARRLQTAGFPDATVVFAGSAIELALKQAIFRPIVYGLVNSGSAAVIIAELSLRHTALDRFKNLLLDVLAKLMGANLRESVDDGSRRPLWEEITTTQGLRNGVLHRGEARSIEEAEDALRVSAAVVERLYPAVVLSVGLHMHGTTVCAETGEGH